MDELFYLVNAITKFIDTEKLFAEDNSLVVDVNELMDVMINTVKEIKEGALNV